MGSDLNWPVCVCVVEERHFHLNRSHELDAEANLSKSNLFVFVLHSSSAFAHWPQVQLSNFVCHFFSNILAILLTFWLAKIDFLSAFGSFSSTLYFV